MKILAISDTPSKALWDYCSRERLAGVDLILSCGDLPKKYLEYITNFTAAPILYVHGNHDGCYDRAHKGFACFNDLLEEYQPKWFVHGHVHLSYNANLPRVCTHGQTTVINATERYTFEIPDPDPVARKRFFWNDPAFPTKN